MAVRIHDEEFPSARDNARQPQTAVNAQVTTPRFANLAQRASRVPWFRRVGWSGIEGSRRTFIIMIKFLVGILIGIWVVKNGIRFSAMPSFGSKLSDTEMWQVTLLLRNADKLSAPVQDALRSE